MARPQLPPPPLLDPGWYPDPTGRYEARYWDGRKWSSHISHYGATGADPLLRARFDLWWVRTAARVAFWSVCIIVGVWAAVKFWPGDDRDLDADTALAAAAVMGQSAIPEGWNPAVINTLSPLSATVDGDDVEPAGCAALAGRIRDGADEPREQAGWAAPDGVHLIAEDVVVWGSEGAAKDHLEDLHEVDAGPCLVDLWTAALNIEGAGIADAVATSQIDPSYGDGAVWWRLSAQSSVGLPLDVYADVVAVRTGRVVITYRFSSTVQPLAIDLQRDVISAHVRQIAALAEAEDAPEPQGDPDSGDGTGAEAPDGGTAADGVGGEPE